MKPMFIVNPKSRGGVNTLKFNEFKDKFKSKFFFKQPNSPSETIQETRKALHDGFNQIIALGGDGTLNCVVNGFFENNKPINCEASLLVAKWGTGSDYFKSVKDLCGRDDWENWIDNCKTVSVDVGTIVSNPGKQLNYFVNITSIGMSARVAQDKNEGPSWIPKELAYIIPTLRRLATYPSIEAKIKMDNEEMTSDILALFVAKGTYSGGGMKFGELAGLSNGFFDITVINKVHFLSILNQLPKLYKGDLASFDAIKKYKTKKIEITTNRPVENEFEGEFGGEHTYYKIEIIPKSLNICIPH